MTFEAVVISRRVQYITELLYTLNLEEYWFPDYHDIIQYKILSSSKLLLQDGTRISLYEKYAIQEYQLVINEYAYTWYDRDGNELLRADNSKHHDVITSPHHLHDFRSARERIKPFFGQLADNPDITEFFAWMHGERR